ncbi:hypothetical protein SDJN03_27474, partial [Cucurbita argyrosperma subsp. sororia]
MIVAIVLALAVGLLGWVYQALKPPPPKICGSANGPPLTSPRVKLRDGRHLAYREVGVPKEEAQYKIIICHSYNNSKDMHLPASQTLRSFPCGSFSELLVAFRSFSFITTDF